MNSDTGNNRVGLLIESHAMTTMLQDVLARAGFAAFPLPSLQALTQCETHGHPAAILADLSLCQREECAREVMTSLRERISPPPHLFCMASSDDAQARLQAVHLGATRFFRKPVDTGRLIAALKEVTAQTATDPFRVVLIDDDRAMTTMCAEAMQAVGIESRTVSHPLATPAVVADFLPDVIVIDVYMPGCSGLELAAMLRLDDSLADTPVLFLSGETGVRRQMAALGLGADDFLVKPVNAEVLQATVIAHAKRARMLKRRRREYQRVAERLLRIEMAVDRHSIVSITDASGIITYVNQRFCEFSGYAANELIGANHRMVKSGVHPPETYQAMWEAISQGRTWHGEVCNRRKDGSLYWVDATITPQLDDHGLPLCYISVRTDITRLKELQAQLTIAKTEAEAASQTKTLLLGHVSHELVTPLHSIIGFSQLMQLDENLPPTPGQADMLNAIEHAGHRLLAQIKDLLDLTSIETGHDGLAMEETHLRPLIGECLALLKPQAKKRGIRLEVEESTDSGVMNADRIRVKQVLLNLLSNAVKYNRDQGNITVGWQRRGDSCHVFVRDSGVGIAAKDQPNLFLPSSRTGKVIRNIGGTGIGLSLSKSLIERMGGRIGVISKPGEGSEFWFELPSTAHASNAMQRA